MSDSDQLNVTCRWDGGWAGKCKANANSDGFCEKHHGQKCVSCGKEAVRACADTGVQFVCGAPLCATCQHGHDRTPVEREANCGSLKGYLLCKSLDWVDIRAFLVKQEHFIADAMGMSEEVFSKICTGDTRDLPGRLMHECSVWIDGYKQAQ